jgi:hypothetical protein
MLPTLTPHQFVAKWRKAHLKESAAAQEHFVDLCRLVVEYLSRAKNDPFCHAYAPRATAQGAARCAELKPWPRLCGSRSRRGMRG